MTDGRGLYDKYEVYEDGEPVEECFVLEPRNDRAARAALFAYANAVHKENRELAEDIREWVGGLAAEADDGN